MRTTLRKCSECGSFTLQEECPSCHRPTVMPLPPRYSPQDRWGDYRRKLMKEASQRSR